MDKINKILVIGLKRAGDALMSSALCTSLKKSFPDAGIHYAVNKAAAPLFLHSPDIDNLITINSEDRNNVYTFQRKVRRIIKENNYDVIIDAGSSFKTSLFARLSKNSAYRIGFKRMLNGAPYNYVVRRDMKTDTVSRVLELLVPLAGEYEIIKEPGFKIYCTEEEREGFRSYMVSKGVDMSKPVILCGVTSRRKRKAWNMEYMREVIRRIDSRFDVQMVFNYAGSEEKISAIRLKETLAGDGVTSVFTNVEAIDLRELVAMTANSGFYFGNEGGTRRIAQALDVPSFAIFPPGMPKSQWLVSESPGNRGMDYISVLPEGGSGGNMSYSEKFNLVKPEIVWKNVEEMLRGLFPASVKRITV